ncbi:MAG: TetR/AcrR family transcriptional regulator [Pseudomonadota bacterium]
MTTRAVNMERRRDRILHHARLIIGAEGFDALNLRDLAAAADVTVPTIYNLVGNKEQLLLSLHDALMSKIEALFTTLESHRPLEMAEAIVNESTALLAKESEFYRAAFLASAYIEQRETPAHRSGIRHRSIRLPTVACEAALAQGLLRGNVAPEVLGEQMFASYRAACRDWACQKKSVEQFRVHALVAMYLCLAADATDDFRAHVLKKINELSATPTAEELLQTVQ